MAVFKEKKLDLGSMEVIRRDFCFSLLCSFFRNTLMLVIKFMPLAETECAHGAAFILDSCGMKHLSVVGEAAGAWAVHWLCNLRFPGND